MYIVLIILIFIAAILLILAVLAQNPKSGMAANFGASNQVMGVRQTSDFLEKSTWGLAIAILALSLAATMAMPKDKIAASKTGVERAIEQSAATNNLTLPNQMGIPAPTEEGSPATEIEQPAGESATETPASTTEE